MTDYNISSFKTEFPVSKMKFRIHLIDQYTEEVVYCYIESLKKHKGFSMGKRTVNSKRNVIILSLIFGLSIFLLSYTYLFQYPFLISKLAVLKSLVAGLLSGIILSIILSSRFYTKRSRMCLHGGSFPFA